MQIFILALSLDNQDFMKISPSSEIDGANLHEKIFNTPKTSKLTAFLLLFFILKVAVRSSTMTHNPILQHDKDGAWSAHDLLSIDNRYQWIYTLKFHMRKHQYIERLKGKTFLQILSHGSSLLGTGFGMKCKPLINYTMDTWSCFWYMDAPSLINSSEADTMCAGFGGSLSPFFSDDIYNGFVVKQLNTWIGSLPEYIWFGLNDVKEESIWRSWYGFSVENSIWWDKSQPDGNSSALDEDCTVITSSSKKLQDRDCSEEIASGAICFMYTAKNVGKRPHVPHQEAYYREEQTLHGFVFIQNKVFTRNIDDRDRCLSECLARKECISVVHISNDLDVCHGYSEIFDIGSLKIPNQSAKYFITYNS